MASIQELATDPKFLGLPGPDRRAIAAQVDPHFGALPERDQDMILGTIAGRALGGQLDRTMGGLSRPASPSPVALETGGAGAADVRQAVQQRSPDAFGGVDRAVEGALAPTAPFLATAARVVPSIVGGVVAGVPGAMMGGAAGGLVAQELEQAAGLRDGVNLGRLAVDTAAGALPGIGAPAALGAAGQVGFRAVQGGVYAAGVGAATNVSEGLPASEELIRNFTLGAGVGGIAGLAQMTRVKIATKARLDRAIEAQARDVHAGLVWERREGQPDYQWQRPLSAETQIAEAPRATAVAPDVSLSSQRPAAQAITPGQSAEVAQRTGLPPLPPEITEATVSTASQKGILETTTRNAAKTAEALAGTEAAKSGQRYYLQLAEAISKGDITVPDQAALDRAGISLPDYVVHLKDTIRGNARQMNFLSQAVRQLKTEAARNPELAKAMESLGIQPPTLMGKIVNWGRDLADFRRAALTSQIATTSRNLSSQGVRSMVEAVDQGTEAILRGDGVQGAMSQVTPFGTAAGRSMRESIGDAFQFLGKVPPSGARQISDILEKFPIDAQKLMSEPAAESVLGKYGRVLNTFNSVQEKFYRRTIFDARLRGLLAENGMDVMGALRDPATIPPSLVETAVRDALEGTYAANPSGGIGKGVLQAWKGMRPIAELVNPFPRFFVNAYSFLMDHSPAGYLRLMGTTLNPEMMSNPKLAQRTLARAHVGTMMLAGGLALRNSPFAGEKWYQMRTSPDSKRVIDLRAFAPFSTYAFMGEALKQMTETGSLNMTTADIAQGVVSMNRIAGTGLVAVDLLREGSADRKAQMIGDVLSQYLGGFTVPFATAKDIQGGWDPEAAKIRDTRTDRFTTEVGGIPISAAPAMRNVPGLSQMLPESKSPLRSGSLTAETPAFRQFSGISTRTKNEAEQEVDRLALDSASILPSSGVPTWDRAVATAMGPLTDAFVPRYIGSKGYRNMRTSVQRLALDGVLGAARKDATTIVGKVALLAANPKFQQLPPEQQIAVADQSVPGFSGYTPEIQADLVAQLVAQPDTYLRVTMKRPDKLTLDVLRDIGVLKRIGLE